MIPDKLDLDADSKLMAMLVPDGLMLLRTGSSSIDDVFGEIAEQLYPFGGHEIIPLDHPDFNRLIDRMVKRVEYFTMGVTGPAEIERLERTKIRYTLYGGTPHAVERVQWIRAFMIKPGAIPACSFINFERPELHGLAWVKP